MKKKILYSLLFIGILASGLFGQQVFDGIAAIVGDEIVTISDINALITSYAFQNKLDISREPELYQKLGQQFLDRLIDQKLLLIKADEDTIKADDERVEANLNQQIDYMIKQAGSENKLEEYYSEPLFKIKKDLRDEIVNQMRISMLREKNFMNIKISRKEVEDFYTNYKDSLPNIKASVDISHILMQVTPSEESVKEAFLKINEIKTKLENGEDFATLARKYSEDPGSAQNGGELGFVSRGTLVKEFEEAAFSLKEGEISDIVQTQFGFHIIQLMERQGERIDVRHILIQLKPTQEDELRVINKLKDIRQKILNSDSTFEEMALRYSADPNVQKDSGHLGSFEEGGFQIKEFENAISNLKEGEISEPFKTDFGYHIVRLNKRNEARQLSLSNDWEQIEQWALQHKQEKQFETWMAGLRQEVPVVVKIEMGQNAETP
jgi:peptidyl-prolyl cis-trans isomerase SurA